MIGARLGAVILLLACGCAGPERRWPFPAVEAASEAAVLEILAARTARVRTLYAVLSMGLDMPGRGTVAQAVVNYRSPRSLRMTAFKDMFVSSRGIFDLLLLEDRFLLEVEGEKGPERKEGPAGGLGEAYPGFGAFSALEEALFLPGRPIAGAPVSVGRRAGSLRVATRTRSGLPLEWDLDPATLGVQRGRLDLPGSSVTIEYLGYREIEGRFFPEEFVLTDARAGLRITGVLEDLELNPDLGDDVFDAASLGGARR